MSVRSMKFILPAAAAIGLHYSTAVNKKENKTSCSSSTNDNSAFVFIKPHANTKNTQDFVKKTLLAKGIAISKEGEITGETIDKDMLIDQHYYAIASKV